MAKNFKGKAHKPPLSAADIIIYTTACLFSFALAFCILFLLGVLLPTKLAFADPNVIACLPSGILFAFPLIIFFGAVFPCVIVFLGGQKVPLLGNRRYKPPAFHHIIMTTPVFSREFRQSLSEPQKKSIRSTVRILLIGLLISLLLYPFSLYPRFVFTQNQEFITYNAINHVKEHNRLTDATRLGIEARYYNGKTTRSYLGLNFSIPGKELICLDHRLFSQMTTEESLQYLLELKSLFPPDACGYWGLDDLERVIDHRNYTPTEIELVYQLFDLTP